MHINATQLLSRKDLLNIINTGQILQNIKAFVLRWKTQHKTKRAQNNTEATNTKL